VLPLRLIQPEVNNDRSSYRLDRPHPIGKAYRGALNNTEGATLLGHAISEAVARAKVDPPRSRTW
jgi:hypothetical protein